ncbi:hypothetical protein BGZ83_005043 [Gryganskiella cystojenkinii]|nr:hypothetical protein BGZ83_005043 [Gryganskiella cystojenkinii]
MQETQLFRIAGTTIDIKSIEVDKVNGQNVIYWEDIEHIYPGVQNVCNGSSVVKLLRDTNRTRIVPHVIKHYPGVILDVIMSTTAEFVSAGSAMATTRLGPLSMTMPGFQNTVMHKLEALHDQGATTQQIAREVWELQKQMNDRLVLIQSKTETVLTQQLELAEYPIPRLFIVLPEEPVKYDPGNWFRTKFRLHFICECGKHTEICGSKLPNHLHLAKHEGYLVREPTKFFKKYGPFLLLMLELIKFGTSIAGHVVPALASLKVVELAGSVQQTVKTITAQIDYSLECIDKQLVKVQPSSPGDIIDTEPPATMTQQDLANYLGDVEGLEGVELRQLGSFLKTSKEDNLLGNLYRMTTSAGHVKWVCLDHYRAGYQEKHVQKLRDVVKLAGGSFSEQLGRIDIALTSSIAASEFYDAINKAKGVLELAVALRGDCSRGDLEGLKDALRESRVSILQLDLRQFRSGFGSILLSMSARYDALFRIPENHNMKVIHYILPPDVTKIPSFLSKSSSHLCQISCDMRPGKIDSKGAQTLAEALKTNSTLTTLNLSNNKIGDIEAQALAEALKTNSTLTTLTLLYNQIRDIGAQALAEALKTNNTLTVLELGGNDDGVSTDMMGNRHVINTIKIGDLGALALAGLLKTNSTLTTLSLLNNEIRDTGAHSLVDALRTNRTLTDFTLKLSYIDRNGAVALAKALVAVLKINSTLTTLNLSHCNLGDLGAQTLAGVFKTNSTLTKLSLKLSSIGDIGAHALACALKTNSTLTTLNLQYNDIRYNGEKALAEAVQINPKLTVLVH